jgi:anti-anti-sigma factor
MPSIPILLIQEQTKPKLIMELSVETLPQGIRCVHLSGRLDLKGTMEIELKFTGHVAGGKQSILIDLSKVDYLASIGIRMLLSNYKSLHSVPAKMILLSPQPAIEETLKTTGLDGTIPIARDLDAALAIIAQP